MASRRARLKAVANLPVRRKPGGSDETPEQAKTPEKADEDNIVPENEVEVTKNQETEDTGNLKLDATSNPEPEPEKIEEHVIQEIKKEEKKPSGPTKFNRRIKPIVNLPIRKERMQANNSEITSTNKIETPHTEKLSNTPNDVNNELSSLSELNAVIEKTVVDSSNEQAAPVNINVEIKQPDKPVSNIPQSPVKAAQRPVFLRPNIDFNIRRPNDDLKNLSLSQRVRNISESSNSSVVVQNVMAQNDLSVGKTVATILKRKRPKSNDLSRKMADARREFHRRYEKIKPDRSSLRMIDLIFYNPTTNPMISKTKTDNKKEGQSEEEILAEEKVDDPDGLDSSKTDDDLDDENLTKMPVPQVKIGLNGEIILDEKSLVIETTDAKKGREDLQNSVPVFEDRSTKISYYCRKSKKSKDWTDSETKRFYKALNTIGTDFLLMQQIFPNRDRLELKNKFKREEKLNRNLVDKALNNPSEFDMTQLEKDLEDEKRIEEEETELKLQRKTKPPRTIENKCRARPTALLSKEMAESDGEFVVGESTTPDDIPTNRIVTRRNSQTEKLKKMREVNMLYEKFVLKSKTGKAEPEPEPETETQTEISDQNENLTVCNDFNKTIDFENHGRKAENDAEGNDDGKALDLTVDKKSGRKRKLDKIDKRKKKRRKEALVYKPDVGEEKKDDNMVVTKTITDQDFYQLLAANFNSLKESNIKVQVTEDYAPGSKGPGKKIEIILEEVPPITLKEIEDQNVTVLADCNTTICEDESPKSPEENAEGDEDEPEPDPDPTPVETSVIVENPNAPKKPPEKSKIENENVMLVIDESDQAKYEYIMVEQEVEPVEVEIPETEEVGENVDVENVEADKSPALVLCKNPQTETEKMYLAGLSAGSFVLMASDAEDQPKEKKLSMFMISEKSQSDGSSVLSSMPVMLPPELLNSLTQELDCS